MGKIWILCIANIRKAKGHMISLSVFVLIATMLLSLGLMLIFDFGKFFDTRAEALHAPHYSIFEEKDIFSEEQLTYLSDYPGFSEIETEKALSVQMDIQYNNGEMPAWLYLMSAENPGKMNGLEVMEGTRPKEVDEICLPYLFKVGGGYELEDDFEIKIAEKTFSYKISGFTEELFFGSINTQIYKLFLSEDGYEALEAVVPAAKNVLINVRLENPNESERLHMNFVKTFFFEKSIPNASSLIVQSMDYEGAKLSRTMISSIISIIMIVFAALIVIISLIVIRFRIRNSIEEGLTNIGALKAVGYTSGQIMKSIVLQFCSVSAASVLLGIVVSYLVLPVVSKVLEAETAMDWQQGFDLGISIFTCTSILLVVFLVSLLASVRIRNLHPLVLLRGGFSTHNFKRNYFPLDRARGPISLLLAMKTLIRNKGQGAMVLIIVMMVAFAGASGLSMYFNLGVNPDAFANLLGGEVPDAAFTLKDAKDASLLRADLDTRDNVRKCFYYQNFNILIGESTVNNVAAEDFSQFEGTMLYKGRYPKHDNEIVITAKVSEDNGKDIGDVISLTQSGRTEEFLITGLIQSVNSGGYMCGMTLDGAYRLQPDYEPRELYVYLSDTSKCAAFIEDIEAKYGPVFENVINLDILMETQLGVFRSIFAIVAAVIFAVTVLVILLVLYLILGTVILRGRRELGIQKALGFTAARLMNQISLSVMPSVVLGVVFGGTAGALGFNSIFVALVKSMGIMTASMPTPIVPTIIMCVVLILISYAIASLISRRIRKINPYTLITE